MIIITPLKVRDAVEFLQDAVILCFFVIEERESECLCLKSQEIYARVPEICSRV